MNRKQNRQDVTLSKELLRIEKQENNLEQAAQKVKTAVWKRELEQKLPENIYTGLESAFCKGFSVVFNQGRVIIEKGYNKDKIRADHAILDYTFQIKGSKKELKQIRKNAKRSNLLNLAATTVEGIGLGALGIGMPDIVLFLSTLLKGIYETALCYGFDYGSKQEQLLILKMMETALSNGERWIHKNAEVEEMLRLETVDITDEECNRQIQATASTFAMDMLLLKFIQGLPIVGVLGGTANPVYYNKVMKYIQLKYRKRYILNQKEK